MNDLDRKAIGGLLRFLAVLAIALFLLAGRLGYWQGWIFLGMFSTSTLAITVYLMKKDRALLERRMAAGPGAEQRTSQKIIQAIALAAFIGGVLFPAIDHRFGWSTVSPYAVGAGDVLVALGLLVVFLVFRENSFASATIEIGTGQRVVSTGPYGVVRHPMYSGAIIMLLGVPPALGSWWGLLGVIPMAFVMVWRLRDEEIFLLESLPGYADYRRSVRYRLAPFIW